MGIGFYMFWLREINFLLHPKTILVEEIFIENEPDSWQRLPMKLAKKILHSEC